MKPENIATTADTYTQRILKDGASKAVTQDDRVRGRNRFFRRILSEQPYRLMVLRH
jgi:hypothetical protein